MVYEIKNKTLYELIFKQRNVFLDIALVLISVGFLAVMANIRIPLWPVPITMQTFGVFTIAFFFGSLRGSIALLAYALIGLLGIGVFAGFSSGLPVFLGPTGGYIIGFIFAAFAVGYLIEKGYGRTWKSILLVLLIGEVIIYAFGLPWLAIALPELTFFKVLMAGLVHFIIGDALKMFAAAGLFPYLWKGAERIKQ
ncbi:biotin transporter BioY [Candidatus Woesearchaeota archaeon]|jgi:biotin transport system substrate-specific component|nr:biotin transporter BioY [Candidatus Woesearchaeota archaeon]|tara:strand:- start:3897 stop:4484 length:588 start_codon:yes stop_codon:yes gene_type:complete